MKLDYGVYSDEEELINLEGRAPKIPSHMKALLNFESDTKLEVVQESKVVEAYLHN